MIIENVFLRKTVWNANIVHVKEFTDYQEIFGNEKYKH